MSYRQSQSRKRGVVPVTLIIGAVILLFGAFVSYRLFYVPKAAAVAGVQEMIRQENKERQLRLSVAGQLSEFAESLRGFPLEADSAWLSRQLVVAARESGVRVHSLLKADPVVREGVAVLRVDVELKGDYHQIGLLIDSLERSPTFLWIEKLNLRPDGQNNLLNAELVLSSVSLDPLEN